MRQIHSSLPQPSAATVARVRQNLTGLCLCDPMTGVCFRPARWDNPAHIEDIARIVDAIEC